MLSRRSLLRSTAGASVLAAGGACIMQVPSVTAEPADPMLELIREYQRQYAVYLASDETDLWFRTPSKHPDYERIDAAVNAVAERTYRPIMRRLDSGEDLPPVTTMEGAAGCIAYVLGETEDSEMEERDRYILRAVAAFLEGRAGA